MPSYAGVFQFGTLLSVALSDSWCISASRLSSNPGNCVFSLFIHSTFLLYSFCFHILHQNFFCLRLLVFPCVFFIYLLIEFSFVILEDPVFFVILYNAPISFASPFRKYLWFISFICIVILVCCCILLIFSFYCFLVCFLSLAFSLLAAISLFVLLCTFPIQVLYFCWGSLRGYRFHHWQVLVLFCLVGFYGLSIIVVI